MQYTANAAEVAVYALVNFLPYLVLAMMPFSESLRYSIKVTAVLIVILTVAQVCFGLEAVCFHPENAAVFSILCTVTYAVFYFAAIKEPTGKLLFTLLMVSNISNLVVTLSKCLEGHLFPEMAVQPYRWTFSLLTAIVQLIVLTPLFISFKKRLKKAFMSQAGTVKWQLIWLIPAVFYVVWYYTLYFNEASSLQLALKQSTAVFLLLINAGALFIYGIVIDMIELAEKNYDLEAEKHQLNIQNLQYDNLKKLIDEARYARHDLRQHLRILSEYAKENDYLSLNRYLDEYVKSVVVDEPISYCSNMALNSVIVYYAQCAAAGGIEFSASACVPENISIKDTDLTVIFGNLLENACEACFELFGERRFISLQIKQPNENTLLFAIDNSFSPGKLKEKEGHFESEKRGNHGIGIESVRSIVERYDGVIRFEEKGDTFLVSGLLRLD